MFVYVRRLNRRRWIIIVWYFKCGKMMYEYCIRKKAQAHNDE